MTAKYDAKVYITAAAVIIVMIICVEKYRKSEFPFNKELSKTQLDKNSPRVDIKASYFINMDRSVDRRESFIRKFNESGGPQPLIRSPGVLIEDKTISKPGDYGCSLAHSNCLRTVSENDEGWYLICEDDGVGDFGSIQHNLFVRTIVHQTNKVFINLSSQIYQGRLLVSGHSLSKVHARLTAYLIHSSYALELSNIVRNRAKTLLVDLVTADLLKESRFFNKNCNGKGAFVGIIDPPSDKVFSERLNSV